MADIENTAKELLTRFLWDQQTDLDATAQIALATWVYKTGLMLECAATPRRRWSTLLREDLLRFYKERRPKQEANAWIGRYDLLSMWPDMPAMSAVHWARFGSGYTGTITWMTACYALFVAGRWEAPRRLQFDPVTVGAPANALIEIWPVASPFAHWPPPTSFLYSHLEVIRF